METQFSTLKQATHIGNDLTVVENPPCSTRTWGEVVSTWLSPHDPDDWTRAVLMFGALAAAR